MLKISHIPIIFLVLFLGSASYNELLAQEKDFQIWGDVSAKYKINKKFSLASELGLRTRENSRLLKQYYAELGGSYKINKRFDVGLKYRFVSYYEQSKTSIHRLNADISFDKGWGRFSFKWRERYQQEWFVSNYKNEFDEKTLRSRWDLSYNIKKTKLEPFFSLEHYLGLNGKERLLTTQIRWTLGADFPVNKWSDISISYRIEKEYYKANPLTAYVLILSYKIDLN